MSGFWPVFRFKILISFVGLAFIWGGAFVGIKVVVTALPPIHAAAIRMAIAVPFLWITFRLLGRSLSVPRKFWVRNWIAGLFMIGIPYAFVFWGETKIPAGVAGIINGTVPLWTALITVLPWSPWFDRKQRLDTKMIVGLVLGFVGLLIIFAPKLNLSGSSDEVLGLLAVVVMALCYSLSNVLNARLLIPENKVTISGNVYHQHAVSLVFLVIAALIFEPGETSLAPLWEPKVLFSMLFLGILSGATALLIYYFLIREIGAIRTSAITYLIPVGAVILDFVVLGSKPNAQTLLGAGFILGAVFFIRTAPAK